MNIYIGADHGGFPLKEKLKTWLKEQAYDVTDVGAAAIIPDDDYPDYALTVAEKVGGDTTGAARGIVICRSGFGVDIVANKIDKVRAALAMSPDHAFQGRHDDDVNVLAIAADFVDEDDAMKIVKVFLSTPFAKEEKYSRRLKKIADIEANN